MSHFTLDGQRLEYTEYAPQGGSGREGRVVVLLHGLLLSQLMHQPLAEDLAARGNRVITLDLLGHGRSDRPRDMWRYSMSAYGRQVVALLDRLGIEEAVVMGTSLGANAALEIASASPERLRGLVIEMPVLDNGLLGSALAFTPLLVALTFGEPLMKVLARAATAVPRRLLPHYGNVMLDVIRQQPGPSGALMQGLFFGRVAPPREERRTFTTPTLVLGHMRDPVHPFSDAGMLAKEMPNARLIEADSLVELRTAPERLTNEIADFLEEVWKPRGARGGRPPRAAKRRGGASRRTG
ncbi:MAG: alpha/beta fold hydrolase, partial [Solirubrobacteraceae bacterium]